MGILFFDFFVCTPHFPYYCTTVAAVDAGRNPTFLTSICSLPERGCEGDKKYMSEVDEKEKEVYNYLRELIRGKGDGNFLRGWRRHLDPYCSKAVCFREFCRGLVSLGATGDDAVALWRQVDVDKSESLSIDEVDVEAFKILEFLREYCTENGGASAVWDSLFSAQATARRTSCLSTSEGESQSHHNATSSSEPISRPSSRPSTSASTLALKDVVADPDFEYLTAGEFGLRLWKSGFRDDPACPHSLYSPKKISELLFPACNLKNSNAISKLGFLWLEPSGFDQKEWNRIVKKRQERHLKYTGNAKQGKPRANTFLSAMSRTTRDFKSFQKYMNHSSKQGSDKIFFNTTAYF